VIFYAPPPVFASWLELFLAGIRGCLMRFFASQTALASNGLWLFEKLVATLTGDKL
jgi:hypothetical protein